MSDNWHYKLGGQEFGPVSHDELAQLLKQGEIGPRTPVRANTAEPWCPIGTLPEFATATATAETALEQIPVNRDSGAYAPFWRRGIAFAVDAFAILVARMLVGTIIGVALIGRRIASESPDIDADLWIVRGVYLAFPWLYFTVFEGSSMQATPGKLLMKVIVTDSSGYVPGYGRAALRSLAKYVSFLILPLSVIIVLYTDRKQAFHDFMANTVVVRD